MATGALTLTTLRLLGPHLTAENHEAVLARAANRTRREIDALVAELAPKADAPAQVRRVPAPRARPVAAAAQAEAPPAAAVNTPPAEGPSATAPFQPTPRPVVAPLAPERYRVQFTIGAETEEKLRRLQALLRREIPDGDPAAIFDRAISLLLDRVERTKLGNAGRPRPQPPVRSGTDKDAADGPLPPRELPNAVKRAVWERDGGRCAYVSPGGRRCDERAFLEFHHIRPHAMRGEATLENIALRCRRHNQYEAELFFGSGGASIAREGARPPVHYSHVP